MRPTERDRAALEWASQAARDALFASGTVREFAADTVLWTEGTEPRGVYIVLEGEVKVVRAEENGRQHVIHRGGPGALLGQVPMLVGGDYPATAIAARRTRCLCVMEEGLREAMAADPELGWHLLRGLAERVEFLVQRLHERSATDVRSRVVAHLADRHRESGGGWFRLPGTQAELAEELGTAREVVVRVLAALRRDGILESDGRGRYRLRDADRAGG